jgi:hypothetical protein
VILLGVASFLLGLRPFFTEGHTRRVNGRTAAICGAIGFVLWAGGLALAITVTPIPGFVIALFGVGTAVGPATIWAMGRFGILDSIEKYRRWMDSAPKREPPVG